MMCSAIKAITGLHANHAANLARERCRAAGYLSANTLGYDISGTLSPSTAEGDNSVLLSKTASEYLRFYCKSLRDSKAFAKHYAKMFGRSMSFGFLGCADLESLDSLHKVLENHEFSTALQLRMKMSKADKKEYFETLVFKEQHLVQELGRAYGERLISMAARNAIAHADREIQPILTKLHHM